MTRAAHLALVLVLVMMSLVPLTVPVAAQQSLPADFLGTWAGRADTPNFFSRVTIALSGGQVGEIVGTIDYPAVDSRAVACGGNVQLSSVSGSQVTLIEKLNYGTAACSYADGTITLTLQRDGSLAYTWSHPNNPAVLRGTLTRTGGTTGGTTGGSTGNDWCAQLAATYGPLPTSSGPWYGPLEQNQGYITRVDAGLWVADFVATAIFYNPTTSTTVPWDFGFAFRQTADQQQVQQILLDSNGTWYYAAYPQGVLASGEAPSYNFSPGIPNTLDLVVDGDTASFCLNGPFVSTVQLPPAVASDVYVVTGFFDWSIVTSRVVDYERFSVWALPTATAQVVPPSTCQWTGTWNTEFGSLRLSQSGATVSGDYDVDQGQINGTVSGNVLRGTWNEAPSRQPPTDAGDMEFTMNADCQSFTGRWRYGSSGDWSSTWSGQRVSN